MSSAVEFLSKPLVTVKNGVAEVTVPIRANAKSLEETSLFIHWGPCDREGLWIDDEVSEEEILDERDGVLLIRKVLTPDHQGEYALTVCAGQPTGADRTWQGGPEDNVRFEVNQTNGIHPAQRSAANGHDALAPFSTVETVDSFMSAVNGLVYREHVRGLGQRIFELAEEHRTLRRQLPIFYRQLKLLLSQADTPELRESASVAFGALQSLGIGEVVFVTPEGHHASAGGLARVITGLGQALVKSGISVTVITPLYEEPQGHRHQGAEQLIQNGVSINGQLTALTRVGQIKIPFGPTRRSGTMEIRRSPWVAACPVYEAAQGLMRVLFIRHRHLANRLYPEVYADEALMRAIFLSRGALEVMTDPELDVKPHIIITNDWLAGLVPAFLETDPRYRQCQALAQAKTVHVIHNCGRGYQGRLYVNQYDEDLWPLLNIGDEHFFGIADPKEHDYLNLTGAAIYHVKNAIVAVSQPYAEQLLTADGAEGLQDHFRRKENLLYGISNGVEMDPLRRLFWEFGEQQRQRDDKREGARSYDEKSFLKYLPLFKEASKLGIQQELGLPRDRNAVVVSFIGRITEQKGVELLVNAVTGDGRSPLELLLKDHPEVQLLIAGPPSITDPAVDRLLRHLTALSARYPGRIAPLLQFVSHERALQLTLASDLLLMPSRYEPGGISQLEALAAGTLVVARNVGGLTATLSDYEEDPQDGNAFLFDDYEASHLHASILRALKMIQSQRNRRKLLRRAVFAANDWAHRTYSYIALFQHLSGVLRKNDRYPFLQPHCALVEALRPRQE